MDRMKENNIRRERSKFAYCSYETKLYKEIT